jgi:NADPH-dependent glutamate synthase beta subunit-like oxidoreductase
VDIITNSALGRNFTLDDLFRWGYRAVFLGIGAHRGQRLKVPGAELPGVVDGITFLRKVNLGRQRDGSRLGEVAVIGGGNTAVDAARSALRLGAEDVTIIYRRTRAEMPVSPWELEEAEREGIKLEYLAAPARVIGDGRVRAIECLRVALGEPDRLCRLVPLFKVIQEPVHVNSFEHRPLRPRMSA